MSKFIINVYVVLILLSDNYQTTNDDYQIPNENYQIPNKSY